MSGFDAGRRSAALLLILLLPIAAGAAALRNQLVDHPSPYLALHGHDPVAWQEWNAATIARARRENKLLFVSVGYFACYWCHIMQRESYKNPQITALLTAISYRSKSTGSSTPGWTTPCRVFPHAFVALQAGP